MKIEKFLKGISEEVEKELEPEFVKYLKRKGKWREGDFDKFDKKEVEMGLEVEKEHSPDYGIRLQITLDHLAEFPTYYTHLKKMEKEAEKDK